MVEQFDKKFSSTHYGLCATAVREEDEEEEKCKIRKMLRSFSVGAHTFSWK